MYSHRLEKWIIRDGGTNNRGFGVCVEVLMPCVGWRRNRVPCFPVVTYIVKDTVAFSLEDIDDGFTVVTMAAAFSTRRNFPSKMPLGFEQRNY